MNVVIDDHLLRQILLEQEPDWVAQARGQDGLFTTGSWFYRLCRSLQDPEVVGALSGPIAALPHQLRVGVIQRVVSLPASIQLPSLRDMAWTVADLASRHGLNLLAAEALAVALGSQGAIATTGGNLPPKLEAAALREGVRLLQA